MHRAQVRAELPGQGPHSTVRPTRLGGGLGTPRRPARLGLLESPRVHLVLGDPPLRPPVLLTDMCAPAWPHCLCGDEAGLLGSGGWVAKQTGSAWVLRSPPESARMLVLTARGLGAVNCLCCLGQAGAGPQPGQAPPTRRTSAQGAWEQWGPFPRQEDSRVQGKGVLQVRTLCLQGGGRSDGEGREGRGGQKLWPIAPHGAGQA